MSHIRAFEFVRYLISSYGAGLIYELFDETRHPQLFAGFINFQSAVSAYINNQDLGNRSANPVKWWSTFTMAEKQLLIDNYEDLDIHDSMQVSMVPTIGEVNAFLQHCIWLEEHITEKWLIELLGDDMGKHMYGKYEESLKMATYFLIRCDPNNLYTLLSIRH